MFTGIVEELGEVAAVERLPAAARITIRGPRVTDGAAAGDSVAVNGVCLTISDLAAPAFRADVMAETLRRSTLAALAAGAPVNLERPLRLGGRLGGHLVQGHVDGVADLITRSPAEHWDVVRLAIPAGLGRYVVEKGSVALDGVSLTVSAAGGGAPGEPAWFEVSLIPTTLAATTLGGLAEGSRVNLEVDVIGKYVERLLEGRQAGQRDPAVAS